MLCSISASAFRSNHYCQARTFWLESGCTRPSGCCSFLFRFIVFLLTRWDENRHLPIYRKNRRVKNLRSSIFMSGKAFCQLQRRWLQCSAGTEKGLRCWFKLDEASKVTGSLGQGDDCHNMGRALKWRRRQRTTSIACDLLQSSYRCVRTFSSGDFS